MPSVVEELDFTIGIGHGQIEKGQVNLAGIGVAGGFGEVVEDVARIIHFGIADEHLPLAKAGVIRAVGMRAIRPDGEDRVAKVVMDHTRNTVIERAVDGGSDASDLSRLSCQISCFFVADTFGYRFKQVNISAVSEVVTF